MRRVVARVGMMGMIVVGLGLALPGEARAQRDTLTTVVHRKITQLSETGDALAEKRQYVAAIAKYNEALALVPAPKTDWEASTWLYTAIGDAHFMAGSFGPARDALAEAMRSPGAVGNPFVHLRLGQAQLELGDETRAADNLARAYLQEGVSIFAGDHPKYLAFIKSRLRPPPGGWPAGW